MFPTLNENFADKIPALLDHARELVATADESWEELPPRNPFEKSEPPLRSNSRAVRRHDLATLATKVVALSRNAALSGSPLAREVARELLSAVWIGAARLAAGRDPEPIWAEFLRTEMDYALSVGTLPRAEHRAFMFGIAKASCEPVLSQQHFKHLWCAGPFGLPSQIAQARAAIDHLRSLQEGLSEGYVRLARTAMQAHLQLLSPDPTHQYLPPQKMVRGCPISALISARVLDAPF